MSNVKEFDLYKLSCFLSLTSQFGTDVNRGEWPLKVLSISPVRSYHPSFNVFVPHLRCNFGPALPDIQVRSIKSNLKENTQNFSTEIQTNPKVQWSTSSLIKSKEVMVIHPSVLVNKHSLYKRARCYRFLFHLRGISSYIHFNLAYIESLRIKTCNSIHSIKLVFCSTWTWIKSYNTQSNRHNIPRSYLSDKLLEIK